jgi:N-acetylneuraminic acid mutarotase
VKGESAAPRDEHTAVLYENSMVIFGGFAKGFRTNSIERYFFKENKWEYALPMGENTPCNRAGHSAIVYGDTMIVFGGKDEYNNKLDDLWMFNFSNYLWEQIDIKNTPISRSGHSA